MALTQTQWIARFTGDASLVGDSLSLDDQIKILEDKERREEIQLREVYIQRAHSQISGIWGELEKAFRKSQVQTTEGSMDMIGENGDQSQGFGFIEDIGKVNKSPENLAAMTNAQGKVLAIQQGLEDVMVKRSVIGNNGLIVQVDVQLFTKRDIEEELYTVLVRSLLFPEELVADDFSATQRMIDGSNDYYIEELKSRTESGDTTLSDNAGAVKAIVTASKDLAVAVTALATDDKAIKTVVGLSSTIAEAVINTSIDVGVAISKADAAGGVSVVLSGLSSAVEALVKQYTGDANLAKYIGLGMKGGAVLPKLVAALASDDSVEKKGGAFIEHMGTLFGTAFDLTAVGQDSDTSANAAIAKAAVTTLYASTAMAFKAEIITKIEQRDWGGIKTVMIGVSAKVTQGVLQGVSADQLRDAKKQIDEDDSLTDQEKTAAKKKVTKQLTGASKAITATTDKLARNIDTLAKGRERSNKQGSEEVLEGGMEEMGARLEEEEEAFQQDLLVLGKSELSENDLKSIGKLIAKLQRDTLIMQTAMSIGGAGFAVASQFFAPMAIAGTILKFIETLGKAINRAIEMRKWVDSVGNALNAVSPYLTSIQNFVKNQAEQFSHYAIKCALIAVQAAAQIAQTAGAGTPAQGVGLVVEKGAKLAETIEDLTYKFYRQAALKKAWKVTRPALENPKNRKANLIARKLNPTLAKYTIAYGAVIEKDTVALEAFNAIGLDNETLAAKDASVSSVKTYLETRYSEDIQVYGPFEGESEWIKKTPAPALTANCFLTLHLIAIKEAKLEDTTPNEITKAFSDVEEQQKKYAQRTEELNQKMQERRDAEHNIADPTAPTEEETQALREVNGEWTTLLGAADAVFNDYVSALRQLRNLLGGFAPVVTSTQKTNADFQGAIGTLAELADGELISVNLARTEFFDAANQLPTDLPLDVV